MFSLFSLTSQPLLFNVRVCQCRKTPALISLSLWLFLQMDPLLCHTSGAKSRQLQCFNDFYRPFVSFFAKGLDRRFGSVASLVVAARAAKKKARDAQAQGLLGIKVDAWDVFLLTCWCNLSSFQTSHAKFSELFSYLLRFLVTYWSRLSQRVSMSPKRLLMLLFCVKPMCFLQHIAWNTSYMK